MGENKEMELKVVVETYLDRGDRLSNRSKWMAEDEFEEVKDLLENAFAAEESNVIAYIDEQGNHVLIGSELTAKSIITIKQREKYELT